MTNSRGQSMIWIPTKQPNAQDPRKHSEEGKYVLQAVGGATQDIKLQESRSDRYFCLQLLCQMLTDSPDVTYNNKYAALGR